MAEDSDSCFQTYGLGCGATVYGYRRLAEHCRGLALGRCMAERRRWLNKLADKKQVCLAGAWAADNV